MEIDRMQALLTALQEARFSGLRSVSYDGKTLNYGSDGLCCTNPVWDSSHESSVVAGIHEQTYTPDLQDQELASLQ